MGKTIIFLFILFVPKITIGQDLRSESVESDNFFKQSLIGEKYYDMGLGIGSHYFRDNWMTGSILLASGLKIENVKLRYNGFIDRLIWFNEKIGQVKLDKPTINKFVLKNQDTIFYFKQVKLWFNNDSINIFCQVIHEGKFKIYVYRKVKLTGSQVDNKTSLNIYTPKPIYILLIKNKTFTLRKARLRAIYAAFPDLKIKIRQTLREKKLKIRDEKDFIAGLILIEYILMDGIK